MILLSIGNSGSKTDRNNNNFICNGVINSVILMNATNMIAINADL
jgi:hypothetical protein